MLNNLKYNIYQFLGIYFPLYFKRKTFSNLYFTPQNDSKKLPPEKELLILQLFIDKSSVIIDIGANNGLYCYYFQDIIGAKEIYAFEPIPNLYLKLTKWFQDINFYPYAISDQILQSTLKIPYINNIKYDTRAKLDNLIEENETKYKEVEIQTNTLDNLFLSKLNSLDFIKIDIEGHELNAIIGAKELITKYHPVLMIEIEKRHHNTNFNKVIVTIESLGYDCYFFDLNLKKILPFKDFKFENHQNEDLKHHNYINNFIFLPKNNYNLIELNNQIENIFQNV